MFIAIRLPLIISAKSEMLSISLFAEEARRPCTFYKHYVPTALSVPIRSSVTFEAKLPAGTGVFSTGDCQVSGDQVATAPGTDLRAFVEISIWPSAAF